MNTKEALEFLGDLLAGLIGEEDDEGAEKAEAALQVLHLATQWQPMETAPKDRRSILIRNKESGFVTTCKRTALKINGKPVDDWYADYYDRYGDNIRVEFTHQCVWKELGL